MPKTLLLIAAILFGMFHYGDTSKTIEYRLTYLQPLITDQGTFNYISNEHIPNRLRHKRQVSHFLPLASYPKDSGTTKNCWLLFNEIKLASSVSPLQYLELRKGCERGGHFSAGPLKHWWIMLLDCKFGDVHLIANLRRHKLMKIPDSRNVFFLLGSSQSFPITDYSMRFDDEDVQYAGDDESKIFDQKGDAPNLLLLMKGLNHDFYPFHLGKDANTQIEIPLPLTESVKNFLRKPGLIKDALVYRTNAGNTDCPAFSSIFMVGQVHGQHQEPWNERWGVRETGIVFPPPEDTPTSSANSNQRYSINRCVHHEKPFDSYAWKVGKATPILPNDCKGKFIRSSSSLPTTHTNIEGPNSSNSDDQATDEPATTTENIDPDIADDHLTSPTPSNVHNACPARPDKTNSIVSLYMRPLPTLDNLVHANMDPPLWERGIDSDVMDHILSHQPRLFDQAVLNSPEVGYWVQMVPDAESSETTRYSCKICVPFSENGNRKDRTTSTLLSPLMTPQGMLYPTEERNNRALRKHPSSTFHKDALDYIKECLGQQNRVPTATAVRQSYPPQERYWIPTVKNFQMAMQWIQSGAAFRAYQLMMNHVVDAGAAVGQFFINAQGLLKILFSVSKDIHRELMDEIDKGTPTSLIIDTYQDKRGRHCLGIAIVLFYNNVPATKYYRLIEMKDKHDAETIFNLILEAFVEDDIDQHMRQKLVAFAADGAAVNRGIRNSIHTRLEGWTGRKIHLVWCYGHRVQLVIQAAAKNFPQVQRVMQSLRDVSREFGPTGVARNQLLQEARRRNVRPVVLTRPFEIRWAHSFWRSMHNLWIMYDSVVHELRRKLAENLTADKRVVLKQLLDTLTDRNYVITLAFLIDVFKVVDKYSLWAQQADATMLNMSGLRYAFIKDMRRLYTGNGPTLSKALEDLRWNKNVHLTNPLDVLRDFEDSVYAKYRDVDLVCNQRSQQSAERLGNLKREFVKGIIDEIHKYFPEAETKMFSLFSPLYFADINDNEDGFDDEFEASFRYLLMTCGYQPQVISTIYQEWKLLAKHLAAAPEFVAMMEEISLQHPNQMKKVLPHSFWYAALRDETIPNQLFTDSVEELIQDLLVIPSGSVEIERIFSQVSYTLGSRRLRMNVVTADHVLRVRKNLPKDTRQWDAFPYVLSWLDKDNSRVDDETNPRYRNPVTDEEQNIDDIDFGYDDDPDFDAGLDPVDNFLEDMELVPFDAADVQPAVTDEPMELDLDR